MYLHSSSSIDHFKISRPESNGLVMVLLIFGLSHLDLLSAMRIAHKRKGGLGSVSKEKKTPGAI